MFNIEKRKYLMDATVGELIEELQKFPSDTAVSACGGDGVYIHVDEEDDGSITGITLDYSALDEEYEE